MTGGAGNDIFSLVPNQSSDFITDFTSGEDKLNMRKFNLTDVSDLAQQLDPLTGDLVVTVGNDLLTLQNFGQFLTNDDVLF